MWEKAKFILGIENHIFRGMQSQKKKNELSSEKLVWLDNIDQINLGYEVLRC